MSEVTQEEHWFKENGDTTKLPNRKLSYIQRRALFLQGAKTILGVVSGSWFVSSCTQQKQNLNSLSPSPALSNVKVFRILKGHVEPILSVAWSPDSTRLVSGGFDYTVKQWDKDYSHNSMTPSLVHPIALGRMLLVAQISC